MKAGFKYLPGDESMRKGRPCVCSACVPVFLSGHGKVRKAIPACPFYAIRFTRRPAPGLVPSEGLPDINDDYPRVRAGDR